MQYSSRDIWKDGFEVKYRPKFFFLELTINFDIMTFVDCVCVYKDGADLTPPNPL